MARQAEKWSKCRRSRRNEGRDRENDAIRYDAAKRTNKRTDGKSVYKCVQREKEVTEKVIHFRVQLIGRDSSREI